MDLIPGPYLSYMDDVIPVCAVWPPSQEVQNTKREVLQHGQEQAQQFLIERLVKLFIDGPTPESPESRPKPIDTDLPSYDEVLKRSYSIWNDYNCYISSRRIWMIPMALHPHHQVMMDDHFLDPIGDWEYPEMMKEGIQVITKLPSCLMHHPGAARYSSFPGITWTSRIHQDCPGPPGVSQTPRTTWTAPEEEDHKDFQTIQRLWPTRTRARWRTIQTSRTTRTSRGVLVGDLVDSEDTQEHPGGLQARKSRK